jgi:hypothetical protein
MALHRGDTEQSERVRPFAIQSEREASDVARLSINYSFWTV